MQEERTRAPTPVDLGFPFPPSLKLDLVRILNRAKAATDHATLIKTGRFSHPGLVPETAPPEPALPGTAPTATGPLARRNGRNRRNTKLDKGQRLSPIGIKRKRAGGIIEKNGRGGTQGPVGTALTGSSPQRANPGYEKPSDRRIQNGPGHFVSTEPSSELQRRQLVRAEFPRRAPDLPVLSLDGMPENPAEVEPAYTALDDIFREAELRELVEQMTGGGNRGQTRPGGFSEGFGVSRGSFSAEIRAAQAGGRFDEEFPSGETRGSGEDTVENVAAGALEMAPRAVSDFVTQVTVNSIQTNVRRSVQVLKFWKPHLEPERLLCKNRMLKGLILRFT